MKVLIEIGHPGHVHQFKGLYRELTAKGWQILFVAKDKEFAIRLLDIYNLPYRVIGKNKKGIIAKILSLFTVTWRIYRIAVRFRPDLFISRVSPFTGPVSFLMRKPHITFNDTEHAKFNDLLAVRFVDAMLTGESFTKDFQDIQVRYQGTIELSYMHPKRLIAQKQIYNELGVKEGEKYIVVRFVAWQAHHDVGQGGLASSEKIKLVHKLAGQAKVFITSEAALPEELIRYRLQASPEKIHDILAFAALIVSEGSTLASEGACLGIPTIYMNSLEIGACSEQIRYGLMVQTRDLEKILDYSFNVLNGSFSHHEFALKHQSYMQDKIDVTAFWVWFVENYPESFRIMKNNPEYQLRFK